MIYTQTHKQLIRISSVLRAAAKNIDNLAYALLSDEDEASAIVQEIVADLSTNLPQALKLHILVTKFAREHKQETKEQED